MACERVTRAQHREDGRSVTISPRLSWPQLLFSVALGATACEGKTECGDITGPSTTLSLQRAPDFAAVVISNSHKEFFAPSGFWISQYELWVAISPSDTANAGVVVAAARPVFLKTDGLLIQATPDDISPGDSIEVWHDTSVAYGSVQAPPGAPAYTGLQIAIFRAGPSACNR